MRDESCMDSLNQLICCQAFFQVEKHLAAFPEEAKSQEKANLFRDLTLCYPLHVLCRQKNAPPSTTRALVDAEPGALMYPDSLSKNLPVHVACWYGVSCATIKILIGAAPKTLTETDIDGNTPLHLAVMYADAEVVSALLKANSLVANHKNKHQQTPLHCACLCHDIDQTVIAELIKENPEAAKTVDWQQRLPLHSACQKKANIEILKLLLDANPEGCLHYDRLQQTPYTILHAVFSLPATDDRCKFIRKYIEATTGKYGKVRNYVQFAIEDMQNGRNGPRQRRARTRKMAAAALSA